MGLPAAQRPADVSWWIKCGRADRVVVKDASRFATEWDRWWDSINPAWRTRENGVLTQGGAGDWACVWVSGTNGFVNLIEGLLTLRDILDTDSWAERLRDVSWVLEKARAAKEER